MSLLINHFYRFGEFTLDADQKVLLCEGKPLPLAPKVFETLLILVEHSGRIVEKRELMNRLWPDTFVEEANLTYSIQQLRKALGDNARIPHYVETVPRRGYRFIASVEAVLSDTSKMGGQIAQRFESAGNQFNSTVETQESEPPIESSTRASDRASTGISKRYVAVAVATVIVLAGVAIVLWKFSNGPNTSSGKTELADSKFPVAPPLKLEKLTGTGQSRHVAISPDGKYIAYTRYMKGRSSIWLRQLATNTNVEIVQPTTPIYGLCFTDNGEYLFFARREPNALYRVPLLGGLPVKIVDNLEGNFSISADNGQITFIRQVINRDGQREYALMVANLDGTGERALLAGTHPSRLDVPVWSPDGQSIICAYGTSDGGGQTVSIIEVRVADGIKKELSSERFFHISKMAWLPDKSGLMMSARKNLGYNNQLWRVSYPGIEISRITEDLINYLDLSVASGADRAVASQAVRLSDIWVGSSREPQSLKKITQAISELCWAPNGRLVYMSTASGNVDIWIMQPDGSEQKQLTFNPAVDEAPRVTPDNRYIVFTSNRTGALQIWRMDIDGSNQIQLTDGAGKTSPAISPDGKWVLYNTTDDWRLWKVSIEGGEARCLTEYIASRPAVSPDGKMIACIGRTESKRELLILPFEGGQPLKRFDFTGWSSRLQWTADGKALIYAVELNGATAMLKQPLSGGQPEELVGFDEDELFDFGYSPDGQFLAVTRGGWQHDIVLISYPDSH